MSCSLGPPRIVIQPYMWCNPVVIKFQVLLQRADGFVSLKQAETLFEPRTPIFGSDCVHIIAMDRLPEVDEAILFLCHWMLKNLSELVLNNSLYTLREEWRVLKTFYLERRGLPLIFEALPESLTKALKKARLRRSQLKVTKLDDVGNVIMRTES